MKTRNFSALLYTLILGTLLFSCAKEEVIIDDNSDSCINLSHLRAHPLDAVTKDEQIRLSVDYMADVDYHWTGPENFFSNNQNPIVSDNAGFRHKGWYYVSMSLAGCTTTLDSVYVNIQFPQGSPSCQLINNQATLNGVFGLGNQVYSVVSFGPDLNCYRIVGNSNNGDLQIYMSVYWATHDLVDGTYYTAENPAANELDKVFMTNISRNILWTAEPRKPLYVSHVGGKARISFCDISFAGDWDGTLYRTSVNAQLTQP